ncbi:hypothetical protein [Paludibaculum fermentans]|uniref:hypothetical protein n=1 Tax=Paludibaculum fermentans TaxID=1473598 RepID=UPI003EB8CD5A
MFRISTVKEPSHTTIMVDGQLMSDSVETVENCCDEEISAGKPVELLLRDLTTIDQAGRALLRRLSRKGVHLLANGVYTSYLVEALNPAKRSPG